jgi:UDP-N-acetylmuramyl tripeptide synthase
MEQVLKEPFNVFVDYAFTPNALEKVYQTLKPQGAKMICVLGACGGGRDKWKRPVLGQIAAKYCDKVIVTNEDPYDEDPEVIINEVAGGVGGKAQKISDRREAIRKSLELAGQGDMVVITGKGCEPWIVEARGKKIPWDDRQVVKEEHEKTLTIR